MTGKSYSSMTAPWARWRRVRAVASVALSTVLAVGNVQAGDLLRRGATAAETMTAAAATAGNGTAVTTAPAMLGNSDRLARTTQALTAVQQMQNAARNLAIAGSNSLRAGLPAVPVNSYLQANGLMPASGTNKLWVGANSPVPTTLTTGSTTTTSVTIAQTQQQALLTWDTFNIGKNTTLTFDQGAGSTNVGQWIAFNYVRDVTGNPTQILGTLKTIGAPDASGKATVGGQVYVMNSNGIIFGGSSQVNSHGLVASSLPINYNLIQRGLLNNPAAQFQFSALALPAGIKGPTPAFDPGVAVDGIAPVQTALTTGGSYGDVVVQPGALLTAPTSADHVGGRIALIGANVTNAGAISTADGQTILAAGLQVGLAPHNSADPTLRGLDVFVGAVTDPGSSGTYAVGTVTNDRKVNSDGTVDTGLISAPRASITLTGQAVNQLGFIDGSTSVAYNGRVDLVAGFNAIANPRYDPSLSATADFTLGQPFFYQSNIGNDISAGAVANSGQVTLGPDSLLRIVPEAGSTERVTGDLALPSQVNIQGQSVYLGKNSLVLAPGAAVPLAKAYAFDGRALEAGVNIRAGRWFNPGDPRYNFVQADDAQQIYLDQGATVDVAGLFGVEADVTENIVAVELRGSELADSPLQRDGPLRGQTVLVDVRQHGAWDATLNGGLGGYTWVGTPLANTAGWVGLTTHTVGELSVNGGSVSLKAGGAVVLQTGSVVDVSGGSINYQGGYTQTSRVVGADGHVYAMAKATPDHLYTGIYNGTTSQTDPKWGVTTTTASPLAFRTYEPGYLQGANGGSLAITSAVLALDGTLHGHTVAGPGQRTLSPVYKPSSPPDPSNPSAMGVPHWLLDGLSRPLSSQLSLTLGRQYLSGAGNFVSYSPTPANVMVGSAAPAIPADAYNAAASYLFPQQRNYELNLSPNLVSSTGAGFGILRLDNSEDNVGVSPGFGNITIKAGTNLALTPGGWLSLSAGNITVENGASVTASGGWLGFNAYDISSSQAELIASELLQASATVTATPYDPRRGKVSIGAGAVLSTAGGVVDERMASGTAGTRPLVTGGGGIGIKGNDILLKSGSALTVSGGAVISSSGKTTYSDAGSITLNAGKALAVQNGFGAVLGGRLSMTGASLEGYAGLGRKSGALDLQAPSIQIDALPGGQTAATDAASGALKLGPGFFNAGGFASFTVTGLGVATGVEGSVTGPLTAFSIAANTTVQSVVQNWDTLPGGSIYLAPAGVRQAASLNFKTAGLFADVNSLLLGNSIDLVLGAGAVLAADAGGSVALSGGSIDLLGRITARGGQIAVTQTKGGVLYTPGIHLGPASGLDASGAAVFTQDMAGYHKADVLDGGKITIAGNLVAEAGSQLNVAGATDTVLLAPGQPAGEVASGAAAVMVPVVKDSNGGTISLQAEQLLFTAASLHGTAGGPTARGGALSLFSNRSAYDYADSSGLLKPTDLALNLTAANPDFLYAGLGEAVTDQEGHKLGDVKGLGLVQFGAASFNGGGFGSLALTVGRGGLQVQGDVTLTASRQISLADGGVLSLVSDSQVSPAVPHTFSVSAPYVVLGMPFLGPLPASATLNPFGQNVVATNGTGILSVRASSLIDAGNLSLQNTGTVVLDATNGGTTGGAIRGDGTLAAAGNITLKAGQVYPPTAVTFNVIANDYTVNSTVIPGSVTLQSSGASSLRNLPLSAGGTLNVFASTLNQGGVLRAPLGSITLGAPAGGGTNPLSAQNLPVTSSLILQPGSVTSVSAIDPVTGKPVTIPYGITVNGDTWIDPTGADITNVGPNAKNITLTSDRIDFQTGATPASVSRLDLTGGGELFAYQFVPGTGGTADILLGSTAPAFAILPGYQDRYAPYASYAASTDAQISLGSDPGYTSGSAKLTYMVGDCIHLEGGGDLPAGDYTLLPARYALLPGAFLVTPRTGTTTAGATTSVTQPDGSVVVTGYRFNGLDPAGQNQSLFRSFEVAAQTVVRKRAQYGEATANVFFTGVAANNGTVAPRLPVDAGQLALVAGTALNLQGTVLAKAGTGGRGGLIDISTSADILIGSQAALAALGTGGAPGTILLDAATLNGFGAESLLIGGVRATSADGTTVAVNTNTITVDNAGVPLSGPDVVLAANEKLILKDGAEVGKSGLAAITADPLRLNGSRVLGKIGDTLTLARGGTAISLPNGTPGNGRLTSTSDGIITRADGSTTAFIATTGGTTNAFAVPAGSTITLTNAGTLTFASTTDTVAQSIPLTLGDGVLLRVGSDPAAQMVRTAVASSTAPVLTVGAGVKITGASAILDSTNVTNLDPTVVLAAGAVSLDSGRVSVLLDQPGGLLTTGSLVLSRAAQQSLLASASSLSLLSYSTLDLYGIGTFGSATLGSLGLHAGAIRGYANSSDPAASVIVAAKAIQLDNSGNGASPAAGSPTGALVLNTGTLSLGSNQLEIQNYAAVVMNATGGVLAGDAGKLSTKSGGLNVAGGDLSIKTPLVAGAAGTSQTIAAAGKLSLLSTTGTATMTPGLAANLSLAGAAVEITTKVELPSGTVSVEARTGDLTVTGGSLDVSGTAQHFIDVMRYTDGGQINLAAGVGNLTIAGTGKISVAAAAGGGSAGSLAISAPAGTFSVVTGALNGSADKGQSGGSFSLDTKTIPGSDPAASHLATLDQALADGGFTRSVAMRVREGDVVADGSVRAHDIALAADHGTITVTGTLDASGLLGSSRAAPLGGTIDAADPTGGNIDLAASGSVVIAPGAWLTAAGYVYDNAGKGGAISLSAGGYTYRGGAGQSDPTGVVNLQSGSRIDLGVANQFTAEDLALLPGVTPPASTRADLFAGTLHLRESQTAFGTGTQFSAIGGSVNNASGIVLEGFQVFDLTGTTGTVSTSGSVTSIGSGGLIDLTVENAVKATGTAFLGAVNPALLSNALFHVQPGAEIVNNAAVSTTITRNFITLTSSATASRSLVNFNLKPGSGVFTTTLIPGGLPAGLTLKTTTGRQFTLTTADGVTSGVITAASTTTIASASATNPVVAINFRNTGSTALSTQLNFNTGTTPLTVAFDPGTTISSSSFSGRYSGSTGDLVLANTWDLSSYRFGSRVEPGNLTVRAKGNLILGFDASLSDGFDPANAIDLNNPLWTAKLMTGPSWSYRLAAGADYSAADSRAVQRLGTLTANSGSLLLGLGGLTLPTATGSLVTRASVIPRYFQTIRTGTGNIAISAGRDVQLLNPLAAIYTAGRQADALDGFDLPVLDSTVDQKNASRPYYSASYGLAGGNLTIQAQNDIARYVQNGVNLTADSSRELPSNWLYRRGNVGADGKFVAFDGSAPSTEVQSTSWWIDFSNFFSDVGSLGGGNVALTAGRNISNVSAAAATNARMPGRDAAGQAVGPEAAKLVELGGGNVAVQAGVNIDGGIYYVERGDATLRAGWDVKSNTTRAAFRSGSVTNPVTWLPTTFFLGKGRIDVAAGGDIRLGAVANPFWQPQGAGNRLYEASYFSTFDPNDEVNVVSLRGTITLQVRPNGTTAASLTAWYSSNMTAASNVTAASQPWLLLGPSKQGVTGGTPVQDFLTVASVLPATFRAAAFAGDVDVVGRLTLAPAPAGSLDLLASGDINGLRVNGISGGVPDWGSAVLTISDADPTRLPGVITPIANAVYTQVNPSTTRILAQVDALFAESGRNNFSLEEKLALHGQTADGTPLHYNDPEPVHLYAVGGDLSGFTLYSAKRAQVMAGGDLADIAFYIQNLRPEDTTLIAAGRDIIAYNPASALRIATQQPGNSLVGAVGQTGPGSGTPTTGDIQLAGPGTLQVLAGRNLNLGSGSNATKDGTAAGLTSVGATRNPYLPQNSGADITALAGVGSIYTPEAAAAGLTPGLATTKLQFPAFIAQFLNPATAGAEADRYLPVLGSLMGLTGADPALIWGAFGFVSGRPLTEKQAALALTIFTRVLRDAARDRNNPDSSEFGTYTNGFAAITALFPGSPQPTDEDLKSTAPVVRPAGPWAGKLSLSTREIKTFEGGAISLLVPGGDVTVGRVTDPQKSDQGILTERGGAISIFAADNVNVGTSRIFTLRGGNEVIWSTWGNIAAGSGSKTVFSAPPTRVLIDPQSGDVQNDLAGLATGSGIGVLATLAGVKPGDVDLIAPVGTIDAGDAGIRSSGNLNLAARVVLNASNIQVGGSSTGTPPPPPTPNLGSLSAASSASAGASSAANDVAKQNSSSGQVAELPSLISVEVLGYGGGAGEEPDPGAGDDSAAKDQDRRKKPEGTP